MNRRKLFAFFGLPLLAVAQTQVDKTIVAKDVKETEATIGTIDGKNTVFTLSYLPTSNASVNVYLNGMHLREGRDYKLSGKALTMTSAPGVGDSIDLSYRGEFNA